ncbi:hypothetical protein [Paenibacillus eucommiae]|uniref:Group-specific protein n=1 Tax=Paenibacillus eucommiae TaxID=1355755 RepID=A0ABS4IPS6_9BACL|nr:hypothetical protein [Paenibacillus eucommiae]MBP1989552.1 hypothetical protein [Paenibacillus eucommiae]
MNNFTIKSNAPYSLNYLVYIQNAFLSNKQKNSKFPSFDISHWGLLEEQLFCDAYKNIWAEMTRRISQSFLVDHNGILETEQKLFQKLFKPDNQGVEGFAESRKSFYAWFSSLTGQITIERAADHILYYEMDIYNEVSNMINLNDEYSQELLISLIYDDCLFGDSDCYSWHSIISLQDIYLQPQKKKLVSKITNRWNNNKREQN